MKQSKLKIAVGLLLSAVMLFSVFVPTFAVGGKCNCGNAPVVSVTGFATVPLYDGNGKKVFPMEASDIVTTVAKCIPYITTYLANKDVNALIDGVKDPINDLFAPIKYNADGTPADPGVHIEDFYPNSAESYDYDIQAGLSKAIAKEIGGDHIYVFTFDWRKSPFEIADELNDYIQNVKKQTGHDKVAVNGQSMGGCIVQTYLAKYGKGDVETVAMLSSAFTGLEMIGQLFTGNVQFDSDGISDIISQAVRGNAENESLLKYLPVIDALLEQIDPILTEGKDRVFNEILIPSFAYMPGLWCFPPSDYFNEAVDCMLGDATLGLKAEVTAYHTLVQLPLEQRVQSLIADKNIKYYCVSQYNRVIAPITPSSSWDSDGVIETAHTSGYAVVAPRNDTLGDAYTQAVGCHDNHVSPDNRIDASTCFAPEHTWFIKNMNHVEYTEEGNAPFFAWLMTSKAQYDIRSNPLYPQFMIYNTNADYLSAYLYEYGDVNLDGIINLVDARLALRHCMNREVLAKLNLQNADVNADGIISKSESVSILNTYAGI